MNTMSLEERKKFGQLVRSFRLKNGLTQETLADRAGIHPTYLGGVERGTRNVSFDNILKIAKALDVPPSSLFVVED